jgi:hypothetical protein
VVEGTRNRLCRTICRSVSLPQATGATLPPSPPLPQAQSVAAYKVAAANTA